MKRISFIVLFLLQAGLPFAQKIEQGFDAFFKPTNYAPRYYVITQKKDSLWQRTAYYIPEKSLAMEGWYKDRDCKIPHGTVSWYHPTKFLNSSGTSINGEKEGIWMVYDEDGKLLDSTNYVAGKRRGISMHWYSNGMAADSLNFDNAGNGVVLSWYDDGPVSSAGRFISDTIKTGRWKYYHRNGTVKAIEDFQNGQRIACSCFDEAGKQLDSTACSEKEASFPGGTTAWKQFLSRNLNADVPVKKGAPLGQYTVIVQFIIDADGTVNRVKTLTHFGFGMEEEVERILKKSPRWIPAQQFGTKVKAYRKQPITFSVSNK